MDYSVAADFTGCLWEDRFVYSFRAAQSNQTYVFLHQSEISDDAFDLHLRSNAVAFHMTLLDTINQLCLGVRFLLFFLHKNSLLAFAYKLDCYFSLCAIFMVLVGWSGTNVGKGKLPVQRLLMGMEIWQAAKQRSEPASETSPRCLKLQVVSSPTLAAGWSSRAFLTQWSSELVFVFKPLEAESGDLTWFEQLQHTRKDLVPCGAGAGTPAFPLAPLVSSHTQTPDWWPFQRTSSD